MVKLADNSPKVDRKTAEVVPDRNPLNLQGLKFDRFVGTPVGEAQSTRAEVASAGFLAERGSVLPTKKQEVQSVLDAVSKRARELGITIKISELN